MQLLIKTPTEKTIIMSVEPTDTIQNIRQKLQDKWGVPPDQQRYLLVGPKKKKLRKPIKL